MRACVRACVPEPKVGGRVGHGAEDVLDGVNDLMDHHLAELVMLALPSGTATVRVRVRVRMRLVFAHECMVVFLLLIVAVVEVGREGRGGGRGGNGSGVDVDRGFGQANVEDDGLDEEHPGDGDQGKEDQRGLHAGLPHVQPA